MFGMKTTHHIFNQQRMRHEHTEHNGGRGRRNKKGLTTTSLATVVVSDVLAIEVVQDIDPPP